MSEQKNFVAYEYMERVVDSSQVSFYLDGYENFGWEMDDRLPEVKETGKSVIHLKRDRKIMNKAELTRLQKHFEDCLKQVAALEQSKTSMATMWSLIVGIIGTAFMAGSVFAVTHTPPLIVLCILLAIPGFAGWILPVFLYKRIFYQKTEQLEPLIEQKQEELYAICEKGHKLLL